MAGAAVVVVQPLLVIPVNGVSAIPLGAALDLVSAHAHMNFVFVPAHLVSPPWWHMQR